MEDVLELVKAIAQLPHVKIEGFMTVAPFTEDPEENRPIFKALYDLSVDIQKQNIDNISTSILSMGMSNDYKIAIEEGATLVRIGTALFGARDYNR
ncbi:MAG: alanine racemase, partial [Zhenhengia sp.]